ncbi:helix-turn-helix domain-containing protein, partial [Steroidobacter sp.]|uniref:helix-turn-helix domain-containing protein n=1 Tax=Steroidobacter sp. TaxID=1978227 RepID=UPI001A41D65A
YAGTSSFAGTARYSGFREGAVWSEAELGTNGMGTCLLTRSPIVVEAGAHFLVQNTRLTCYAAPIIGGTGSLLGAINISSVDALPRGPMLSLLDLAAQSIESRLLLPAPKHFVLNFHRRQEYVGTVAEGVITFTESGTVVGVNRSGMRLLGASAHDAICGNDIQQLFGADANHLAHMHRLHAGEVFPLTWSGSARRGFGKLQLPSAAVGGCHTEQGWAAENALTFAESSAIASVLQRCQWNMTRAAKELGIGRKTLYRKIYKYRLVRPSASPGPVSAFIG